MFVSFEPFYIGDLSSLIRAKPWWVAIVLVVIVMLVLEMRKRWDECGIPKNLDGKHVWVVGGSRGIGRAVALRAAEYGAIVTVTSRNHETVMNVVKQLQEKQKGCAGIVGDVGKGREDIARLFGRVVERNGPVDVLIACAGINHEERWFGGWGAKADQVIDVNFRGVVHLFEACLESMKERKSGVLCAISSLSAYRGVPGASVYGATKAALTSFCQSLNVELCTSGVQVTCIHPGFVDTEAIEHLDHYKPFIVSADKAAKSILYAIRSGQKHYGFPWIMENIVMKFSALVPSPLYEHLLYHTTRPNTEHSKAH